MSMYLQHLMQTGLTRDQAALYEVLIKKGRLPASIAAREAGVGRTLAYVVLSQLQEQGLIEKHVDQSVTTFSAVHPFKLQEMVQERLSAAESARTSLDGVLAGLISEFNKASGSPGIRVLPDVSGLKTLYADILKERQDIRLIRSPNDDNQPGLGDIVSAQIANQIRLGIKTRAITPLEPLTPLNVMQHDADRLVTRRVIERDKFLVPAQIILYANKVALTAYDTPLMTTIIENTAIATTMSILFEYIWNAASAEHEALVKTFTT